MPEELKLVECLAKAGKLPFTVKVSTGGGEYREGDVLEVTAMGHRAAGRAHEGEVTYAFNNKSTGHAHRDWRHDSSARFQLVHSCCLPALPKDVQDVLENADFGCQQDDMEKLLQMIYRDIAAPKAGPKAANEEAW